MSFVPSDPHSAFEAQRAVLEPKIPPWLAQAEAKYRYLYFDAARMWSSGCEAVREQLASLEPPQNWCARHLREVWEEHFGTSHDVDALELVRLDRARSPTGLPWLVRRQSLLEAAMGNFQPHEALEGQMAGRAVIALKDAVAKDPAGQGPYRPWLLDESKVVDISPARFAALCRQLDLGAGYLSHVQEILRPAGDERRVAGFVEACFSKHIYLKALEAQLKGDVGEGAALMLRLLQLTPSKASAWDQLPVQIASLKMLVTLFSPGYDLCGPWVLFKGDTQGACVVYLPGEADHPLKEYPSLEQFQRALRERLRSPAYRLYFSRFVPARFRVIWETKLVDTLSPRPLIGGTHAAGVADPSADIGLRAHRSGSDLAVADFQRQAARRLEDAAYFVCSTTAADSREHAARLADYEQLGLTFLGVASLFVPALGVAMAAVGAVQLLADAFEGIDDWRHGQREAALRHLLQVVENVGLAAGNAGISRGIQRIPMFEEMVPVMCPDGQRRLWYPDLTAYRREVSVPAYAMPDPLGCYKIDGQAYVRLEGELYALQQHPQGKCSILPPAGSGRHAPELLHEQTGVWRLAHEQPLQWDGPRLLRRWGAATEGIGDTRLRQLVQLSGVTDEHLRQSFAEFDSSPPAPLKDALVRQSIWNRLGHLIEVVRKGAPVPETLGLPTELPLALGKWPKGRAMEIFHAGSPQPERVGPQGLPAWLKVTQADLYSGKLADRIVQQVVADGDLASWFGDVARPFTHSDLVGAVNEELSALLISQRERWFKLIYERYASRLEGLARVLRRDFPSLSRAAAKELLGQCDDLEWKRLEEKQQVPFRLAALARDAVRETRLCRAFEWLMEGHDVAAGLDGDRLAASLLDQVNGWQASDRIELFDGSLASPPVASSGMGSRLFKLLRISGDYVGYDGEGRELFRDSDLFAVILRTLPELQKLVPGTDLNRPGLLRQAVFNLATADRARSARLLGMNSARGWFAPPHRLSGGRLGYPLSGRLGGASATARLRALYPDVEELDMSIIRARLLSHHGSLSAGLDVLEQEFSRLSRGLRVWVEEIPLVSPQHPGLRNVRTSRQMLRQRIEAAWRRSCRHSVRRDGRSGGYLLQVDGLHVGQLPRLQGDFSHVRHLTMTSMELSTDPSEFLASFSSLRSLNLSENRLSELPRQLSRLQHLKSLELNQNHLSATDHFFEPVKRLPRLTMLALERNDLALSTMAVIDLGGMAQLERLSLAHNALSLDRIGWQALGQLEQLRFLDLSDNQLLMFAQSERALAKLVALETLNLSRNPLCTAPSVHGMVSLRRLDLRANLLHRWPEGLGELLTDPASLALRQVDLSHNFLNDVPNITDSILANVQDQGTGQQFYFTLADNPLTQHARDEVERLSEGLRALAEQARRDQWLDGWPQPLRTALQALQEDPQGRSFYAALQRVVDTRDYGLDPVAGSRRIRRIAEAVLQPDPGLPPAALEDLRLQLFEHAEEALGTCGDGVSLVLNHMETVVEAWSVARDAVDGKGLAPLVRMAEKMLRLNLLDECAQSITLARDRRQLALFESDEELPALSRWDDVDDHWLGTASVDEAEIRFILRIALAKRLELPPQPGAMLYREEVSPACIDKVCQSVQQGATRQALLAWLKDQTFWMTYLERVYQEPFTDLDTLWQRAATYLSEAAAEEGEIENPQDIPLEPIRALEAFKPEIVWRHDGRLQKVEWLGSLDYQACFEELKRRHDLAKAGLVKKLTLPLIAAHSELPHG